MDKLAENGEMPSNVLEEAERFCNALFFLMNEAGEES